MKGRPLFGRSRLFGVSVKRVYCIASILQLCKQKFELLTMWSRAKVIPLERMLADNTQTLANEQLYKVEPYARHNKTGQKVH